VAIRFAPDHATLGGTLGLCLCFLAHCTAQAFLALDGSDVEEGLDGGEALAVAFAGVEVVQFRVAGGLDRRHAGHERFERLGLRGDDGDLGLDAFDAVDRLQLREDFLGGLGVGVGGFGRLFRCGVQMCTSLTLRAGGPIRRAQEVVMRKCIAGIRRNDGRKNS